MTTPSPVQDAPVGTSADLGAPAPHPLTDAERELLGSGITGSAAETAPAPTIAPPGQPSRATKSAGTGISGQRVACLYAEQTNRNAWAYLEKAGWKKLNPRTDSGSTVMTLLAAHARATGHAPVLDENPAGTISLMYVW